MDHTNCLIFATRVITQLQFCPADVNLWYWHKCLIEAGWDEAFADCVIAVMGELLQVDYLSEKRADAYKRLSGMVTPEAARAIRDGLPGFILFDCPIL